MTSRTCWPAGRQPAGSSMAGSTGRSPRPLPRSRPKSPAPKTPARNAPALLVAGSTITRLPPCPVARRGRSSPGRWSCRLLCELVPGLGAGVVGVGHVLRALHAATAAAVVDFCGRAGRGRAAGRCRLGSQSRGHLLCRALRPGLAGQVGAGRPGACVRAGLGQAGHRIPSCTGSGSRAAAERWVHAAARLVGEAREQIQGAGRNKA